MNNNTISLDTNQVRSIRLLVLPKGQGVFSIRWSNQNRIYQFSLGIAEQEADILSVLGSLRKIGNSHVYVTHVDTDDGWTEYPIDHFQRSCLEGPDVPEI